MTKKEKVIKGILVCKKRMENDEIFNCYGCPYRNPDKSYNCWMELFFDSLSVLREQEKIIEQYHRADGFLAAHGWKWEGRCSE